jgi:hypothetical protein
MPALALLLAGLATALLAQWRIEVGDVPVAVAALYAAAAGLWVLGLWLAGFDGVATWRSPGDVPPHALGTGANDPRVPLSGGSLSLLVSALVLAGATFLLTGDSSTPPLDAYTVLDRCEQTRLPGGGQFTLAGTIAWAGSVGLALAALWERGGEAGHSERQVWRWLPHTVTRWEAGAVVALVALGALPLFWRIASVPAEMTSDHAEKLFDAQFILDGFRPVFFPCNTGREAFQFYWIAVMAPLTGVTYLTMKLGTALLGWLALPFSYGLARTVVGWRGALLALATMVTMRWHWQVSRVGLRFPFPPLFGAAVFFFLLRALRDRRRNDFLLCGLALGVAQHTYTALRLAPIAVAGCVGIALLADLWQGARDRARRLLVDTALLALVTLLLSMPLVRYAYDQPVTFLYRSASRVTSDTLDAPPTRPVQVFVDNVKNAYLMFNWRGDQVWVNTIPDEPLLDPVTGALFVLGGATVLFAALARRRIAAVLVAFLLFAGLLPSILSLAYPAENPSTVRTGMAIPVVALIAAHAPLALAGALRKALPARISLPAIAAGLVALAGAVVPVNADHYFRIYAEQHGRSSQRSTVLAGAIQDFQRQGGRREDAYLLPWAHWVDWRLVAIQAGDPKWRPLINNVEAALARDGAPVPRLYLVFPEDQHSLGALERWYPQAERRVYVRDGTDPWVTAVLVPAGARART